ncbi:MAG TPA: hypothetical protein VE650_18820 [Acetobacteraceae bacterium]|nr:hypothetical protein [Acetobacteraceae bacterium]
MTEEIASTPGWVEQRLEAIFAGLPDSARPARDAYASCLASRKAPAAPSDLLGAEFEACRSELRRGLLRAGLGPAVFHRLEQELEALEADITAES